MNQTWTDENVALLTDLWREGLSASEIAARIGDVSRNAVIGKAHRLKLDVHLHAPQIEGNRMPSAPKRISSNKVRRVAPPPPARPVKVASAVPPVAQATFRVPRSLQLGLMDLKEDNCRWPSGDRGSFTFCGHPIAAGEVYCGPHCNLAYVPREQRQKKAA